MEHTLRSRNAAQRRLIKMKHENVYTGESVEDDIAWCLKFQKLSDKEFRVLWDKAGIYDHVEYIDIMLRPKERKVAPASN